MPELPEVETIKRQLSEVLPGQELKRVVYRSPLLRIRESGIRLEELGGWRISRLERRGKELFFRLAGPGSGSHLRTPPGVTNGPYLRGGGDWGQPEACLRVHLGMTGRLFYLPLPGRIDPRERHLHLVLELERGELGFWDQRRFGRLVLAPFPCRPGEQEKGPDLWDCPPDPAEFKEKLGRARIKAALLDQGRFSGLGNIYADEALFRAGIHPLRLASTLSLREAAELLQAIREVLGEAIAAGGTTFSAYRDGRGEPGRFGARLRVYGREGEPCPACSSPVSRVKAGGRSAYFCARCQPEGCRN